MGKKNSAAAAKAAKKAKAQSKTERKEKKKVLGEKNKLSSKGGKSGRRKEDEDSDDDLEGILEKMRAEWEASHTVTEELSAGPPSQRANASLTPCPSGAQHLWMIGGEFFSEDGRAYFYNDTYRYNAEKDDWRRFVSPTCPGPRSAHAVVGSPAGGGKLFLFGGEFSSLHQTTFHHYRDFWCFDAQTHMWDRIETKVKPSARSGHRMAMWKHFIVLFGGFYDPGITTRYLNDLWVFDTQEYTWKQIELKETELKPSPRSGFSFLPTPDGIILHGGYCKEYKKGQRPVGVMLEDTWFLKLSLPETPASTTGASPTAATNAKKSKSGPSKGSGALQLTAKWERRKRASDAFAPPLRSGCTMSLWGAKGMGVMFGGVTDEEDGEEGLKSVFWGDMYGYQLSGKGRWVSFTIKVPKKGGGKAKKKAQPQRGRDIGDEEEELDEWSAAYREKKKAEEAEGGLGKDAKTEAVSGGKEMDGAKATDVNEEEEDPLKTVPMARYNAMLAVLKNTLYIYGGIFERGSKEYTLDDFYSVQLDKMERFICLKKASVVVPEGEGESSSEDDSEEGDDDEGGESDDDLDIGGSDCEDGNEARRREREVDVGGEDQSADGEPDGEADDESDGGRSAVVSLKREKRETRREKKGRDKREGGLGEEEIVEEEASELRKQASAFMGAARDTTGRTEEDVLSTPLPGETLAMFYARSRVHWSQKALERQRDSENRGKELRRIGFALAEERYEEYKPLLEETERILAEAGLDEEEMRRGGQAIGAGGAGSSVGVGTASRNRR
ncbi:hypothetical protein D9611_009622 [Ephemerocybe angulata]|uniref:DUF4110 domain-containing protein n=1 Tax=Ephemerocybe angulata TaxID=980116 RepID=A0A8H5FFY1_9AGAR|nr:hypothetical protein D9611_009622 [Tulosesus angulatus]